FVRQGMDEGAFGLSAGLEYVPGRWSTAEEVLELAKVVAPYGGHYQAHLRSQGQYPKWQLPSSAVRGTTYIDSRQFTNIDAVMESINIAKRAGVPVILDHLHPKGPREWGSGRIITQLVDPARHRVRDRPAGRSRRPADHGLSGRVARRQNAGPGGADAARGSGGHRDLLPAQWIRSRRRHRAPRVRSLAARSRGIHAQGL